MMYTLIKTLYQGSSNQDGKLIFSWIKIRAFDQDYTVVYQFQ